MNVKKVDYNNIYKSICRVCLSRAFHKHMVCLFDNTKSDGISIYGKLLTSFANISLQTDDILPDMMCNNCLSMLKQAVLLKYTCENSDSQLKNLMEFTDSTTNNYKEIICRYTMMKHYFPTECTSEISQRVTSGNSPNISTNEYDTPIEINLENTSDHKPSLEEDSDDNCNQDAIEVNYKQDTIETDSNSDKSDPMYQFNDQLKKPSDGDVSKGEMQEQDNVKYVRNGKNGFTCNICNVVLKTKEIYSRHIQRHNGCRFMCETCGKVFHTKASLDGHQVIIHGYGPHLKCQDCSYKAPTRQYLIEHIRIHTGERPFTCEQCGLTFRRKALWRRHVVQHGEKSFQCPHCPKKFYYRDSLAAHMNNHHERLYVFMCRECDCTYATSTTVRQHMTKKHGIPRMLQGKIIRVMKSAPIDSTVT